jgi:hypothetical protein
LGSLNDPDVDLVLLVEPSATIAELDGGHRVFIGPKYFKERILYSGIFSTADYVHRNPEITQGLVSAIENSLRMIHVRHLEAVKVAREEFTEFTNIIAVEMATLRHASYKFPRCLARSQGKVRRMKMYLMTPGPTPVAPETQLAMAQPIIHHRSPQFMEILGEVREGLKYLFQIEQEVLLFTATGTGALEGAVTNTLSAGDKALVVDNGKFGERWTELCNVYEVKANCR